MGGLPCAKAVLDQREALGRALGCMGNSILLNYGERQPTEDHLDRFLKGAEELTNLAAEIQKHVSG